MRYEPWRQGEGYEKSEKILNSILQTSPAPKTNKDYLNIQDSPPPPPEFQAITAYA